MTDRVDPSVESHLDHPILGITLEMIKDKVREINTGTHHLILTPEFDKTIEEHLAQVREFFSYGEKTVTELESRYPNINEYHRNLFSGYSHVLINDSMYASINVNVDEDEPEELGLFQVSDIIITIPVDINGRTVDLRISLNTTRYQVHCYYMDGYLEN